MRNRNVFLIFTDFTISLVFLLCYTKGYGCFSFSSTSRCLFRRKSTKTRITRISIRFPVLPFATQRTTIYHLCVSSPEHSSCNGLSQNVNKYTLIMFIFFVLLTFYVSFFQMGKSQQIPSTSSIFFRCWWAFISECIFHIISTEHFKYKLSRWCCNIQTASSSQKWNRCLCAYR